jgi:hypothetical protein
MGDFFFLSINLPLSLLITIAVMTWIGLTNNEPASGYPHTDILYVCVSAGLGLVGAFMGVFFFSVCIYLIGALGGFYLAVWLLSWKASLIITVVSSRLSSLPFYSLLLYRKWLRSVLSWVWVWFPVFLSIFWKPTF